MHIDGKPVRGSGTLVLAAGQSAAIRLPAGEMMPVAFREDSGGPRVDVVAGELRFQNINNPLGTAGSLQLTLATGTLQVNFALYVMGDSSPSRVLHYSVF